MLNYELNLKKRMDHHSNHHGNSIVCLGSVEIVSHLVSIFRSFLWVNFSLVMYKIQVLNEKK